MEPILTTQNLLKQFDGVRAVDNLSLTISKGEITSIIGPNGSGKTTLVNLLSGVLQPTSGKLFVDGVDITHARAPDISAYGITRTFQNVRLFEQMSVLDNILVVLTDRSVWSSLFERHGKFHLNKAEELLKKVNLWEKRNENAEKLSYGQRKLLEISRALAMNSEIYLLDEPFAGLFPEMIKIVVSVIKELKKEGKTVILIEHNMDLIRELSDKVVVMDSGSLLAEGKSDEVLSRRDVIEAYLGE